MSTDEQSQMVDDISSIIMRGRYGRSGVGRPSGNSLDLRDARRIVEYVVARDARVRRDAAREALDGLAANMTQIANGSPDPLTRTSATITARLVGEYKLNVYPEETR